MCTEYTTHDFSHDTENTEGNTPSADAFRFRIPLAENLCVFRSPRKK